MQLQVVGYAHQYRRLLLSLRQADERAADRSAIEAQCSVGAVIEGSVVWVGTGGAVIGMPDGSSGWLPDVELSWSRGDRSVRDLLVMGQPIRLRVVGYDSEHRKLLLSLRQVNGHPIDRVDESAFVGTTHRGVVSNVLDYGVFVRLPIEFDGLLHRSDMPEGLSPSKGDVLDVRVASIDKERRRVALAYVGSSDQRPMTEKSEQDGPSAAQ
jgi:small subunit ribosomal protein S1